MCVCGGHLGWLSLYEIQFVHTQMMSILLEDGMGEIRVHIQAHLEAGDGPRELVAEVRIEYASPPSGGDIDVFADLSELAVDDVTTDAAGDVPKSIVEGLDRRRYMGRVSIPPLLGSERVVAEEELHRRALHRAGFTDEQINRSVFSPQVLETLNSNLAKDPVLRVLLEKRLTGRVNSIVGKRLDEITELVRTEEREAAELRVAKALDVAYGRARDDFADEVRQELVPDVESADDDLGGDALVSAVG